MTGRTAALACLLAAPLPGQTLARGDSLLALGDTNAAIAAYEAAIRRDSKNAEAYHRAGLLYWARASSARLRRTNDSHTAVERFKDAVRIAPDSGRYVVTIAKLVRTVPTGFGDDLVVLMINAVHILAQRRGAAASADLQFIARSFLDEFEIEGRRLLMTDADQKPAAFGVTDRRPQEFEWERDAPWSAFVGFLRDNIQPDALKSSMAYIQYAEETLRELLKYTPGAIDAAGMLVVTLGEGERWQEAHAVARQLVAAARDSGRAHALLGLTLARLDKWREAESAFNHAFGLMTPGQRDPYQNLLLILNQADSVAYARLPPVDRARADSLFWSGQRPLYLSTANEARVEYWARLTYVHHRWSEPAREYQGFHDPRGAVYLRWGPPQLMATTGRGTAVPAGGRDAMDGRGTISTPIDPVPVTREGIADPAEWRARARLQFVAGQPLSADDGQTRAGPQYLDDRIVWAYLPERLRFLFGVQLWVGYSRAFFFGYFGRLYQETREKQPVSFDNVALVRGLDTMGVQIAQFRSDALDTTDVAVFTETPIGRMMRGIAPMDIRLVTAAFVKDSSYRSVVERAVDETVRPTDSLQVGRPSFRLALPPGSYRLRAEAGMPVLGRAARNSGDIAIRSFDGAGLKMSDILVAARVAPRDSAARRWTDFFIDPSAGRFQPGTPISLLWETYNLEPDATDAVHYRVEVRLAAQEQKGHHFAARVRGGARDAVGQTARGENQLTLSFERRVTAFPQAAIVDYLELDLQSDDEATYETTVTVTDIHTGATTSATRFIVVSRNPLRK